MLLTPKQGSFSLSPEIRHSLSLSLVTKVLPKRSVVSFLVVSHRDWAWQPKLLHPARSSA